MNDAPELTGDLSAEVDEAGSYTITAADLGYTDVDDTDTGVTFTVSNAQQRHALNVALRPGLAVSQKDASVIIFGRLIPSAAQLGGVLVSECFS
ncbi:hypothetical protein [Vibrio lentus]|uniref:hypothetical protein n=1 Tax=Vibrio lentus TaxID=136468 RepID=UPI001E580857|nr:hypothetical protein [Vibrio lentus]MCC5526819.1 hypothetical protein [Vibrio lentus]